MMMNHLIFIPKAGQRDGNAGDVSNYGASAVGWTADNQSLTNAGGQAWGYLAYDGTYECVQNFMASGRCILPDERRVAVMSSTKVGSSGFWVD
jgi:hypothetical protein